MPNVRTRKRQRITCDEEERRRRGYEVETYFRFAVEDGQPRVIEADVSAGGDALFRITYGPAATLLRVNNGWRSAGQPGFLVDFESGEVVDPGQSRPATAPARRELENVRLTVYGTQNILLLRILQSSLQHDENAQTSLQYALQRGCELEFQLEESELAAERIGAGEHRAIIMYESGEGGAGVLRRLVEEPDALARVARRALDRCHYDGEGNDLRPECEAACYSCLMSYANQLDALRLDRRSIQQTLLELASSVVFPRFGGRSWTEHLAWLRSLTDSRSELERRFLDALAEGHHRLPDAAQRAIDDPRCIPDFFYSPNICVFCDGSVHDEPGAKERDSTVRAGLVARGFRVVVIRFDALLTTQLVRHSDIFGRVAGTADGPPSG
jgi:hypothetical protein